MGNPFDQFDTTPTAADSLGRPVIIKPATPDKPEFIPGTHQVYDPSARVAVDIPNVKPAPPADKITYRPMSPDDPNYMSDHPSFIGSDGKPAYGPQRTPGDKPKQPSPDQAFQDDKVLGTIQHIRSLVNAPGSVGPGTDYLQHIPVVGNNAAALRGQLQQITGDLLPKGIELINAANGGKGGSADARSVQTQKALISSFAALDPSQPNAEFMRGLDQAEAQYKRWTAEARGLNPDDPQVAQRFGMAPPPAAGGPPPPPKVQPTIEPGQSPDNGITESNTLPAITMKDAAGISTGQKTVTDPRAAAIAPQLEQYLAADPRKVSNAMILGFVGKQGLSPRQMPGLIDALQYRMSSDGAAWRAKNGNYVVDPSYSVPLTGVDKVRAAITASPEGAYAKSAADTATLGTMPDIIGALSSDPNTRANLIYENNAIAQNHPLASLLGNVTGSAPFALLPGAGVGRIAVQNAGLGALHGFFSSEDPSLGSRVQNAANEGVTNLVTTPILHGATSLLREGAGAGYRFASAAAGGDPERAANQAAVNRFAMGAPEQNPNTVAQNIAAQTKANAAPSVATAMDLKGQNYVGKLASGSPQGQTAAEDAVQSWRKALPEKIGQDFDKAISASAAESGNPQASEFLNRPVTDVRDDIQGLAGREYGRGMEPIVNERVTVDPDLHDALDQEPVKSAIGITLRNQKLTPETRAVLRSIPQWLKEGADFKHLPVTVDALRNVATTLDDQAGKLMEGSEARMVRRDLASTIRQSIADQFPEYKPVNDLYSSRMRGIDALLDTRDRFGTNNDTAMDELIKAGRRLSDQPQPGEFNGVDTQPGQPLPSTRQMAMAGAKESAVRAAGANGRGSADATVKDISGAANQAQRTRTVFPDGAAQDIEQGAAAKAKNLSTLSNIAGNGAPAKANTARNMFQSVIDAGIGAKGAAVGAALRGIPNMNSRDSARIVSILTDSANPEQALTMLRKAYTARKAQFIFDRIAAHGLSTFMTRPREPVPGQ